MKKMLGLLGIAGIMLAAFALPANASYPRMQATTTSGADIGVRNGTNILEGKVMLGVRNGTDHPLTVRCSVTFRGIERWANDPSREWQWSVTRRAADMIIPKGTFHSDGSLRYWGWKQQAVGFTITHQGLAPFAYTVRNAQLPAVIPHCSVL